MIQKMASKQDIFLKPTPGLEPGTPFITSEVLYQLSYVGRLEKPVRV